MRKMTTKKPIVKFKKINENSKLPTKATPGSAAYDCYVNSINFIASMPEKKLFSMDNSFKSYTLQPNERIAIGLGFVTEIPDGYYMTLSSRSGMSLWYGFIVNNAPAIIDSDYRDEWKVIITNLGDKPKEVAIGDRICQTMLKKIVDFEMIESNNLSETERNKGGFGSTGK